jgi:glutaredoxin
MHASRQDVHHRRLPVLHPCKADPEVQGCRAEIEEIRIDSDPQARSTMMEITQRRTVPQIFIGDTHVGGCDDLIALDGRGGLVPLTCRPPETQSNAASIGECCPVAGRRPA